MAGTLTGRRVAALAAGAVLVAGLAAAIALPRAVVPRPATMPGTTATPAPSSTTTVAPPPVADPAAVAPLTWTPCHGGHQCAALAVPLDYAQPAGPHIAIALERRLATGPAPRIGSLVINPGGPGESGLLNMTKDIALLPAGVLARFDVIAFDPRGVGMSSPVHCEGDTYRGPEPDPVPGDLAAAAPLIAADRAYAAACAHSSGALLLAHVGTVDVARDLDALRSAVGDHGLTYLGLSYGTLLGATYAQLFPTHVRAMVLDGALDPALSTDQLSDAQAAGFQASLNGFFTWCTANPTTCPWRPSAQPENDFDALVSAARAHPLSVGGRPVGPNEFYTGVFGTLYARSFWPSLGRALAALAQGSGGPMLALYDSYQRTGDPSFNADANNAITCLDHPVPSDPALYVGRAANAATRARDFGPFFAWGGLTCAVWQVPPAAERVPGPVHAPGSGPILVVGTTADPATPFAWAKSLAVQLQHGALLARVGVDHVAIFYSACVRAADEAVLVDLVMPAPGTVCQS